MLAVLLAALTSATSPALNFPPDPAPGRVLLVSTETIADPALAARILELTGGAPALELEISAAGATSADSRERLRIPPRDRARVDSYELAQTLRNASSVALLSGGFLDWYATLLPSTGPSRLAETLRRLKPEGVHVVAYGAAASFAAGATLLPRSALERPVRNPRATHTFVSVRGLSLGPPAVVDADSWTVGNCLELARALRETKLDFGVFLCGEVAIVHEFEPQQMICMGSGAAVVVDLDDSRRQKRAVRTGRMSLLVDGDTWSFGHWRVHAASDRELVPTDPRAQSPDGPPPDPIRIERFDPRAALETLAGDPTRPLAFASGAYRLLLWVDEASEIRRDAQGRLTLTGAAFDLDWE